jgi:hypothetical protein
MDQLNYSEVTDALNKAIKLTLRDRGKSRYPYYTEQAAVMVIDTVHQCFTEFRPVIWPADHLTVNSLYLRFRQGVNYICDKLDPNFGEKLRSIQVTKLQKIGLRIAPREGAIMSAAKEIPWRGDLEQYLEDSTPGCPPFERINLPLSSDDIQWIESTMFPLREMFMVEVSRYRLLIVRLNKKYEHKRSSIPTNRATGEDDGRGAN